MYDDGYSGDVGRFMRQVLESIFSAQFSTEISYTGKCHNKTTPNSKKVALSIYNLITGKYIFIYINNSSYVNSISKYMKYQLSFYLFLRNVS